MKTQFDVWFVNHVEFDESAFAHPADVRMSWLQFIERSSMAGWEWRQFWQWLRDRNVTLIDQRVYRMRLLG